MAAQSGPGAAGLRNPLSSILSFPCSLISSVMPSPGQKLQKLVLGETSAIGSVKVRVDFVLSEGLSKLQLREDNKAAAADRNPSCAD